MRYRPVLNRFIGFSTFFKSNVIPQTPGLNSAASRIAAASRLRRNSSAASKTRPSRAPASSWASKSLKTKDLHVAVFIHQISQEYERKLGGLRIELIAIYRGDQEAGASDSSFIPFASHPNPSAGTSRSGLRRHCRERCELPPRIAQIPYKPQGPGWIALATFALLSK
jgi:hypothetical protein